MKYTTKAELKLSMDQYEAKALRRIARDFLAGRDPESVGPMRTLADKLIKAVDFMETTTGFTSGSMK